MFEALRGVRDAVAPESGNLGMASQEHPQPSSDANAAATAANPEDAADVDEMWRLYRNGDATVTNMIQKAYPSTTTMITRREDFVRIYTKAEMERKDSELVGKFASMVLDKFDEIRHGVNQIPGLHRTRTQQMEYIHQLMEQNSQLQQQLDQAYLQAKQRQARIYQLVKNQTNRALGFDDGSDSAMITSSSPLPVGFADGSKAASKSSGTETSASSESFGMQAATSEVDDANNTTGPTKLSSSETQQVSTSTVMEESTLDDDGWMPEELDM